MAFKPVSNKVDYVAQEHDVLKEWAETDAFETSRKLRKGGPKWSFQDGPITANNPMGVHHGWGRTYKDLSNRFWTMKGYETRYQNGFDCQGLWIEVEVEKEKGFKSKKDIEAFGVANFVLKCKERVLKFAAVQTEQSKRLGFWMDWNKPDDLRMLAEKLVEDPTQEVTLEGPNGPVTESVEMMVGHLGLPQLGGSYFTFSTENNYLIWTFLKKCWENGWVYQGADVMPWCPRCATAISQHEIVTDGYAEITHESITLKFPLRERENESLLVWTTTPWTLTSNIAAAVGPELDYVKVQQGEEIFYLSKGTIHMLKGEYKVLEELKGAEMEGWTYDGPFDELEAQNTPGGVTLLNDQHKTTELTGVQAHKVLLWEEVGEAEGTGIVHMATGCGAEDYQIGKEHNLPQIAPLTDEGEFLPGFGWLSGMKVADVPRLIFEDLEKKGRLYKVENYTHRYPTCWRCSTELVFRLVDEWFISMGETYNKPREEVTEEEKTASLRYQIMDVVDQIRWIPEFGHAREMDWLRNMHDWMISKKRYWGLALPIWTCDQCDHFIVIGDDHELAERAIEGHEQMKGHSPHRPYIDAVKIACPECEATMSRVPDVGNAWLDAGIVPFSTMSYRVDNDSWKEWFPADYVTESFPGQFRNWFYSLLAMSTVIEGKPPFKELFGYATLFAEDGREMHKSWGNSIEFNEAADKMGVDVMRWMYCSHKPENNLLFGYNRADEVRRQFLIPLWNIYSFFVTYANLDGWEPKWDNFDPQFPEGKTPVVENLLDKWIIVRLNQVVKAVHENVENSDAFTATQHIETLIDDLTNWYIRRSRRRFWKSEHDNDKDQAYTTLHHVLIKLIKLLAPFTPFITEVIYQNLVGSSNSDAYSSVHHTFWPEADESVVDDKFIEDMALARRIVSLVLSARNSVGIKVRQPLSKVLVCAGEQQTSLPDHLIEIIAEELNIKELEFVQNADDLISYKIMPNNKTLGPKFGAIFPLVRKALEDSDAEEIQVNVVAGRKIELIVDGKKITLEPEDVLVNTIAAEGLAVAIDKMLTVAIDTEITPELRSEGLAREIVRRIQSMRKNADFNIEDRIQTTYQAEGDLNDVLVSWRDFIMAETLSTKLTESIPIADAYAEEFKLEGISLKVGISR